jgi:superfamily II DNA or RNA helicase
MTAFEQASIAWHRLWELKSSGGGGGSSRATTVASHRREASQQLVPISPARRVKSEGTDSKALVGLQRIYQDPNARPRSEGQASALQLVHNPSAKIPLVIVLPTSSGKSALFFSVAAMSRQQTVIVVVPFAALVDDIVTRGQGAGLQCEEWRNKRSGHELQQLIVVSADRAVQGEFLHYAKGLELGGQLAHVFFDECHVAFTDTSYRERLRELWRLRYLDCPFTALTATLMVELEEVLRERLCIDNAQIFRRSTARRTIRYSVVDSREEAPSVVATQIVQGLQLPPGKRGVVYVRSYATGDVMSEALDCPFYKARADNKGAVLQEWMQGGGGWIVATGALGTGVNIEGIVYVVHVDWPYGLTSFAQQSGRGGRNGEVSDSIIIARVQHSSKHKRKEVTSGYSVESVDEEAMVGFMQSQTCRRRVLSYYLDGESGGADCKSTDSVFCDRCKAHSSGRMGPERRGVQGGWQGQGEQENKQEGQQGREQEGKQEPSGQQMIGQRLRALQEAHDSMIKAMDRLQGRCIYCTLMHKHGQMGASISQGHRSIGELHEYAECLDAKAEGCGFSAYQRWRKGVSFGQAKHCWECGLSQRVCRRLEGGKERDREYEACEYAEIMLPSIFVLQQQQHLAGIVQAVGFQGEYGSDDLKEWLNDTAEGFGQEWQSNWMETWQTICETYMEMAQGGHEEWAL